MSEKKEGSAEIENLMGDVLSELVGQAASAVIEEMLEPKKEEPPQQSRPMGRRR